MIDMPDEYMYRKNKRLIELVETSPDLLRNPRSNIRLKKSLLENMGVNYTIRKIDEKDSTEIPLSSAKPQEITDQLRAIYHLCVEENKLYDEENQ